MAAMSQSPDSKMLRHETKLMEDRISREKHPNKIFFTYANTVATIDFAKIQRSRLGGNSLSGGS